MTYRVTATIEATPYNDAETQTFDMFMDAVYHVNDTMAHILYVNNRDAWKNGNNENVKIATRMNVRENHETFNVKINGHQFARVEVKLI